MGDVVAMLRVMPKGTETDMEKLQANIKAAVPEGVKLRGAQIQPVAFGLKCLKVSIIMPDMIEGGADAVQAAFEKVEDVESVEVTDVGLL